MEGLHGRVAGLDPLGERRPGGGQRKGRLLAAPGGVEQHLAGLVDGGLQLEQARRGTRATAHEARPVDVALLRHRREVADLVEQGQGGRGVGHESDPLEHLIDGGSHALGCGDDVERPHGACRQRGPRGPVGGACGCPDDEGRAAGVVGAQPLDGPGSGVDAAEGEGIAGLVECGGDGGLVAPGHRDQLGDRAEDLVLVLGGLAQGLDAVLSAQAELERLETGLRGLSVAVGDPAGLDDPLDLGLGGVMGLGSALVDLVEPLLAALLVGDGALEPGELAVGLVGSGERGGHDLLEAADLGLARLDAGASGPDLPGEAGQALAAVGGALGQGGDALLLGRVRALGGLAGGDGRGELLADAGDVGAQLLLVGTGPGGLLAQRLRVTAARRLDLLVLPEQAHALGGERRGRGQLVGERGQAHGPLLGGGQLGGRRGTGLLVLGDAGAGGEHRLLEDLAALEHRLLVGHLLLEGGGHAHEVIGKEAVAGVAGVGLDDGGLARGLGLTAEGPELAPDLGRQVGDAREVGLHPLELADRLFLALAVLEDAGGLLDEATSLLGRRAQHGVELPLPDDDVHLATDAGVGEQLLDVEQPARGAVDRVLRAAVAEHRAADRHLGVVDRQRAVGVVDRHRHLGAAQGRTTRGAGEDDVLHLAAPQGLGPLLPHDPGERVDDIGLARAVGPDDARDARLEPHVGRRGERLEALEGEALDVHERGAPRADGGRVGAGVGRPVRATLLSGRITPRESAHGG